MILTDPYTRKTYYNKKHRGGSMEPKYILLNIVPPSISIRNTYLDVAGFITHTIISLCESRGSGA